MKKLIVGITLSLAATAAMAMCTQQVFIINGKTTICNTCCTINGCTTICS